MTLLAYAALLNVVFYVAMEMGTVGKMIISFLVMAVSVAVYFLSVTLYRKERYKHYRSCLLLLKATTLISFYAAGNYFVVRELSISMLGLSLEDGASIPLGWLFWILTVATPLFYIVHGVRNKDSIFLWVGLGLIAATVYSVRHYYHVLPLEWALVLGGIFLVAVSYAFIKYLRIPRFGITGEVTDDRHFIANLHIESLVIAETFAAAAATSNDFKFGGGSGGGAGAGGQY